MKEDKIRAYDDVLLRKERGIKIATTVVCVFYFLLVLTMMFDFWMMFVNLPDTAYFPSFIDGIKRTIGWIFLLLLFVHINSIHLKHIASIKLYRKENDSQQKAADAASSHA